MSFSLSAIYLTSDTQRPMADLFSELVLGDGCVVAEGVDILEVGENEIGVAKVGCWQILFGQSSTFIEKDILEKCKPLCLSGQLFFWLSQSVSGGLWFEYHIHGKLVRRWVKMEGEIAEDEGETFTCENELSNGDYDGLEKDEWFLVKLAGCVTRVTWEEMTGDVFSFPG